MFDNLRFMNEVKERVDSIEFQIRVADKCYKDYRTGKVSASKLNSAVKSFYENDTTYEGSKSETHGKCMYRGLKNNDNDFCRKAIDKLDRKLAKDGISTEKLINFYTSTSNSNDNGREL